MKKSSNHSSVSSGQCADSRFPLRAMYALRRRIGNLWPRRGVNQIVARPGPALHRTVVAELSLAGLGNQMFLFAFALAVARALNAPLKWCRPDGAKGRRYGLDIFGLNLTEYSNPPIAYRNMACGNACDLAAAIEAVKTHEHLQAGIVGHFQREECFSPVADEVRFIFRLTPLRLAPRGYTQVSLQVRRGDYVREALFRVCTLDYYTRAMDHVRATVNRPWFVVVSDDLEWCREAFAGVLDCTVPEWQGEEDGLRAMAASSAHIISNSTYGWWGAWLAGGATYVPNRWLNGTWKGHAWDCAPERWIRLPV